MSEEQVGIYVETQPEGSTVGVNHNQISMARPWYKVGLKDLTVFFLKCVVAGAPAAMLCLVMYIGFIIFNSVAAQVLGGL